MNIHTRRQKKAYKYFTNIFVFFLITTWVFSPFSFYPDISRNQETGTRQLSITSGVNVARADSTASNCAVAGGGTGGAGANWATRSNMCDSTDNTWTSATVTGTGATDYIYATSTNFSAIPASATINGIQVSIERHSTKDGSNQMGDSSILIVKADGSLGTQDKSAGATWNQDTDTIVTFGTSTTDRWGAGAWTVDQIKNAKFGVAIRGAGITGAGSKSPIGRIDNVSITVYYTVPSPALNQYGYRLRANHQGETGTTWLAAENTPISAGNNTTASTTRLRIVMDETASTATTSLYQLEYATSTITGFTSCSALSTWVPVGDSASTTSFAWKMSPSANISNGGATTNNAGLTDPTGAFRAGQTRDITNRLSTGIPHSAGEFTEMEWALEARNVQHVNGQSYCFRVTNADSTTNFTYTQYPKINLATSTVAITQLNTRWRADHQSESGTTWLVAENTRLDGQSNPNIKRASTTRVRFVIDETSTKTSTSTLFQVEYAENTSGTACSASSYTRVPNTATSEHWEMSASTNITDAEATTNNAGLSDPASGSFVAGQIHDTTGRFATPVNITPGNNFTEVEWSIKANSSNATNGGSYCFRVTNADDTTNITYSQYARITLATSTASLEQVHYRWRANNGTVDAFGGNGATTTAIAGVMYAASLAIDANYIYVAGYQTGSGAGETCTAATKCWRVAKYDINTGEAVTAFSDNGATTTNTGGVSDATSIAIDANYIYVAGGQVGSGAGETCTTAKRCARVAKYDINTGEAVTAFSDNGATTTNTGVASEFWAIAVDANYIYASGHQAGSGAGATCALSTNCWRVQKYDITTGDAITAFSDTGATTTYTGDTAFSFDLSVDANYIYVVGEQINSGAGETCLSATVCSRLQKYDITTGDAITAFSDNGATSTRGSDYISSFSVAVDANYIYTAGYQTGPGAGETCTAGKACWRVQKYDITTGDAITAFSDNGATSTSLGTVNASAWPLAIDANYIYVAGNQKSSGAGETCSSTTACGRLQKYDITTGDAITAFSDNGATSTNTGIDSAHDALVIDTNYIYTAGYQTGPGAGETCVTAVKCWRLQKFDINTGETDYGASWLASEDMHLVGQNTASTTRLRILIDETNGTATTSLYQLEYATSTIAGYSSCSALSTWVRVADQASSTSYAWKMSPTQHFVNGATTYNNPGLTDATGTFRSGKAQDTMARLSSGIAHSASEFTELEWSIEATAEAKGDSYCFRVTNADDTTDFTYTQYPRISVATSTLDLLHYRWRANNGGEAGEGGSDWWDTDFTNRRKITFNNAPSSENLHNFPVPIILEADANDDTFGAGINTIDYTKTRDHGFDVRFVNASSTLMLKHEIEEWNEAGTSTVWVKLPFLEAGTTTQYIWMYYNNSATTTSGAATSSVWDANFVGVWHFAATTTLGAKKFENSVGSSWTGILSGTDHSISTSTIGDAIDYDGINDQVTVGDLHITQDITLEAWFKKKTLATNHRIIAHWGVASNNEYLLSTDDGSSNELTFAVNTGIGANDVCDSNSTNGTYSINKWTYVAGHYDGSSCLIYVNGREVSDFPVTSASGNITDGTSLLRFGIESGGSNNPFEGIIDEVRISDIVRSADWIQQSFRFEAASSTTHSFDSEETLTLGGGASFLTTEDTHLVGENTASTTRLRMLVSRGPAVYGASTIYQPQYATSTIAGFTSCANLSNWASIPHAASSTSYAWKASQTAHYADRSATSDNTGLTNPAGGTFVAGQAMDFHASSTAISLTSPNTHFTELEWSLEATDGADGASYCFRVTNNGDATGFTYTQYPRISIATSSGATFTQNRFRLYENTNVLNPSTVWAGLRENEAMLTGSSTKRMGGGDVVRVRMNITTSGSLTADTQAFNLQYARLSSGACSSIASALWKNVGEKDGSSLFRFGDNAFAGDSATIASTILSDSNVAGSYSEINASPANPNSATTGQKIEYDWPVQYRSAVFSDADFCFRMVASDGTEFTSYTTYPRVRTNIVGSGNDITGPGAPVGGSGAKALATTTGATPGPGGGEEGGAPPAGDPPVGGGGGGGGGEVFLPGLHRFFASLLHGLVDFSKEFIAFIELKLNKNNTIKSIDINVKTIIPANKGL